MKAVNAIPQSDEILEEERQNLARVHYVQTYRDFLKRVIPLAVFVAAMNYFDFASAFVGAGHGMFSDPRIISVAMIGLNVTLAVGILYASIRLLVWMLDPSWRGDASIRAALQAGH